MEDQDDVGPFVLGIDLGAHSLGWAVLPLDANGEPRGLRAVGVRTFDAGVEASHDEMIQGKQKSRAAARREKRSPRRQFWRRVWRRQKILKCLTRHGLMRAPDGPNPEDFDLRQPCDQDRFLKKVDEVLRKRLRPAQGDPGRHLWEQVWLYELRAAALERKLDPLELGRAFYHLGQRRGFLSNRKTDAPDDDSPKKRAMKAKQKPDGSLLQDAESSLQESGQQDGEKDDPQRTKAAIEKLAHDMEKAIPDPRFRTLGYYFARFVNPEEHRIRKRWTSRPMYEAEFDAICQAQAEYYPDLAKQEPFNEELHHAIFFQRRLKPCGHLVGHCELEPGRKRALQALPIAQEFRLLQKVNDLLVLPPDGTVARRLDETERRQVIDALVSAGDRTFKQIRRVLRFTEPKINKETKEVEVHGHVFNLERGGEDRIPGDRTAAKILACEERAPGVARRWKEMCERLREELVLAVVQFESNEALACHLQERFGFTAEQAAVLSKVRVEESRCSFSRRALARLVPFMRRGMPFATAKEQIPEYSARAIRQSGALDFLPRVLGTDEKHLPSHDGRFPCFKRAHDLRNPAVTRALAELRKVVNAIVRRYGKPKRIHVELGREAKKSPLQREIAWRNNRLRQEDREAAKTAIRMCEEIGIEDPKPDAITKWLLAEECNWECPYTGKKISCKTLFSSPQFEVEHIVPRSISLDDSFDNLTLCDTEYNRNIKQKRIPYDVEARNPERWGEILNRVKRFKRQRRAVKNPNRMAKNRVIIEDRPNPKAERFAWTPEEVKEFYGDRFTPRQLTDTQYASKLAMEYLGLLYGGEVDRRGVTDDKGIRRVQPSSGGVTAILREEWGLNAIVPRLPDSPAYTAREKIRLDEKLRTDHRHHAVDAVVIACTSPKTIELLSDAARRLEIAELRREDIRDSSGRRRRKYAELKAPWGSDQSFFDTVQAAVRDVVVSRRPERKIQGPLHAETNYSPGINDNGAKIHRQRIALTQLSEKNILADDVIADPRVRDAIRAKWEELERGKPRDVFKTESAHPRMPPSKRRPNGRPGPPIHTVRINLSEKAFPVGGQCGVSGSDPDHTRRHVLPGKNTIHHCVIVEEQTARGPRWRVETVSRLDVLRRKKAGFAVVQKDWGDDRFIMWLCKDDCIEMDDGSGTRRVFVVKMVSTAGSATDIKIRLHHDARTDDQIEEAGERSKYRITSADTLRKRGACKVIVTPLGKVVRVDD